MKPELQELTETFQSRLYLPDPSPLLVMLGAVVANRFEGSPVWVLLVGPGGRGKTELLRSVESLRDVHPAGNITEAGLLSGSSKSERRFAPVPSRRCPGH